MSRDRSYDNGVWKLIKQLEHKKVDSDKTASDKGANKGSMRDRKGPSTASDKNPTDKGATYNMSITHLGSDSSFTDKGATCDKSDTPAGSDNSSTDKGATYEKTDMRRTKEVTGDKKVTRLESDKGSGSQLSPPTSLVDKKLTIIYTTTKLAPNTDKINSLAIDKETTPDKLISDGTVNDVSARTLSTNDLEFTSKSCVGDKEIEILNDKLVTPVIRHDLIMIDDVIRTRLISNPVTTDKMFPIHVSHFDSGASQINGNKLVISKASADGPGRESSTGDDASALKLISNNDAGDKPMRTDASRDKNSLTVKAKRPGSLILSPVSPCDTDEDRTPRPLSGTFRSAEATPVLEFSFVELPLRFRQYQDDNRPVSVPEVPYPDSSGTLKHQIETCKEQETGDVNDDITVALNWIQQELRQMKSSNRALVRQLLGLGASIHQLRGLTDCHSFNPDESTEMGGDRTPDWTTPVKTSASADLYMLLTDHHLTSPMTVKKKKRKRMEGVAGRRSFDTVSLSTSHVDQDEFYV